MSKSKTFIAIQTAVFAAILLTIVLVATLLIEAFIMLVTGYEITLVPGVMFVSAIVTTAAAISIYKEEAEKNDL